MVCNYNDKEMITDVLSTQKHLTDGYNTYANESACESVKNTMMSVLGEEHDIAHEVFCLMNKRGWYPTEAAPRDKVIQAKQKFSSVPCYCK